MNKSEFEHTFIKAYEAHTDAIFRFCFFKTNNRELAKDLTQEVFLRAWTYAANGGTIREFRAFFYRLAQNLVIDWYRKRKADSLDALVEGGFDPPAAENDNRDDRDTLEFVHRNMLKLRPDDQKLIHWRYIDGKTPGEIGTLLGESENTISVRLHRAVKRLRKLLEQRNEHAG